MPPADIKQSQLLQVFKDLQTHPDEGMCFLLGAGASFTSGIPTGGHLAQQWYGELKKNLGDDLAAWQQSIAFDEKRVAEFYTQIFEKRFGDHPTTGFLQLQDYMKNAEPSVGYSFLAQVLTKTQHKFVITTNFDHMVEDAIRTYTEQRPLVCGHESLAQYINARSNRPTIIKVHRDLLLKPFNHADDTSNLNAAWKRTLEPILQHYHLIVIGYGGNDGSLMDYLKEITQRKGIYWCYRNEGEINEKIRNTLTRADDRLVKISGFDEFMLALNAIFDYPMLINQDNLAESKLVTIALAKAERYKTQLDQFAEKEVKEVKTSNENSDITRDALLKLFDFDEKPATNWWQIQFKINQQTDPDKQDALYKDGLQLMTYSAELIGNYAIFLKNIRKDYDQAETYYHKALELDPNHAINNGNYASFLHTIRKDYDQAETYYRKTLELDPNNALNNGNYASFLHTIRKDYDQAETYYRKALELDPNYVPNNGNYALFLNNIRKDYDQAETYYRKALELDPNNALNNGNYALFLNNIRKDYDKAETYYRKALELDPNNALNNGNYSGFLLAQSKKTQASPYLEKALQSDQQDLLLESWFYRLAHFSEQRETAKQQIETLLQQGIRSPGWDFSDNINQAEQAGYPDIEELKQLAARISESK